MFGQKLVTNVYIFNYPFWLFTDVYWVRLEECVLELLIVLLQVEKRIWEE